MTQHHPPLSLQKPELHVFMYTHSAVSLLYTPTYACFLRSLMDWVNNCKSSPGLCHIKIFHFKNSSGRYCKQAYCVSFFCYNHSFHLGSMADYTANEMLTTSLARNSLRGCQKIVTQAIIFIQSKEIKAFTVTFVTSLWQHINETLPQVFFSQGYFVFYVTHTPFSF